MRSTLLIILMFVPCLVFANERQICQERGIDIRHCISTLENEILESYPKKVKRDNHKLILFAEDGIKKELIDKPGGKLNLHHSVVVHFKKENLSLIRIDSYNEDYEYHIFSHNYGYLKNIYGWPYFSKDSHLMAVANLDEADFGPNTIGLFVEVSPGYYTSKILIHPLYGASEVKFIDDSRIEYTVGPEKKIETIKYLIFYDETKRIWKIE